MATSSKKKSVTAMRSRKNVRPSPEEIAKLAYQKFEQRGHIHGFDIEDWLSAETELNGKGTRAKG